MPAYLKKTNHTNFLNVVPGPCNVEMIFSFYQVCSVFNLNLILLKGLLDTVNAIFLLPVLTFVNTTQTRIFPAALLKF